MQGLCEEGFESAFWTEVPAGPDSNASWASSLHLPPSPPPPAPVSGSGESGVRGWEAEEGCFLCSHSPPLQPGEDPSAGITGPQAQRKTRGTRGPSPTFPGSRPWETEGRREGGRRDGGGGLAWKSLRSASPRPPAEGPQALRLPGPTWHFRALLPMLTCGLGPCWPRRRTEGAAVPGLALQLARRAPQPGAPGAPATAGPRPSPRASWLAMQSL